MAAMENGRGGRGCGAQGINRQAAEAQQSFFPSGTLYFLLIKDPRHQWCPYRAVGHGMGQRGTGVPQPS